MSPEGLTTQQGSWPEGSVMHVHEPSGRAAVDSPWTGQWCLCAHGRRSYDNWHWITEADAVHWVVTGRLP